MMNIYFIGSSSYRLRHAERKVYIVFEAHPIRVCFLFFRKKPSKMTATTTLFKKERGDA